MRWNRKYLLFLPGILVATGAWAQENMLFGYGQPKGRITSTEINEASGLIGSAENAGFFWTHNDSGDAARIFLIDDSARLRATYYLQGIVARDWEDIAMVKRSERNYLLVGDIGDNKNRYPFVYVHLFEEPTGNGATKRIDTIPKENITTFVMKYEDGPRDAESLFFDPVDDYLYVIGKRELQAGIYRTILPEIPTDTLILKRVGTIPHTFVTSADIRADGTEILMKNLLGVFYWNRKRTESVPQALKRPAVILPYRPEPQGEAIAFSRDGKGYYTLGESALGLNAILYFYQRR
ncbi:hypothetical protein GCM10011386_21800 [Parapedobacter defluvii]|uniref:Integral membrane protein n=1 Tax=Parapedobacter defluvii TaxID=2045106 RepID=A0ABQ1LTZ3_9SPHI|nr:hypothetical protein [Parapedobacter defluvii]GGC29408.1 hypothetical protein GCM10011386_21800 [Parapedobacter defluvii]